MDKCCILPKKSCTIRPVFLAISPRFFFLDIQCPHGSLFNSPSSVNQRLRVLPIVQMALKEQKCPVIRNVPFTSFTLIYHFLTNVQSMAHLNLVKWFNLSILIRLCSGNCLWNTCGTFHKVKFPVKSKLSTSLSRHREMFYKPPRQIWMIKKLPSK